MPLPTVISDISPIVGTGAAPNAGQPGGGENPSTFDDYLRLYAAFIAQLRAGGGLAASGANRIPFFDAAGALTSAADFVRDGSGNVGIGVAAPGVRMDVQGSSVRLLSGVAGNFAFYDLGTNAARVRLGAAGAANDFLTGTAQNDGVLFTMGSNSLIFGTNQAERMRIDASGHQINTPGNTTPPTLTANGQWNLTPTSNTNMRISYRGTDGVTRVGNITLA